MKMTEAIVRRLEFLVRAGVRDDLRAFLDRVGCDVLYEELDGIPFISNVMIEACDERDPSALIALLSAGMSPDVELNRARGHTLLMRAVQSSYEAVRILIEAGANPNAQDDEGWTAMMYAVALDTTSGACDLSESMKIVALLLRVGADTHLRNVMGDSAMDVVRRQQSVDEETIDRLRQFFSARQRGE